MSMAIRSIVRGSYQVHIRSRSMLHLHLTNPAFGNDIRRTIFLDTEDDVGWYLSRWDEIFEIDVSSEGPIALDESTLVLRTESSLHRVISEADRNEEAGDETEAQDNTEAKGEDQKVENLEAAEDIQKDPGETDVTSTKPSPPLSVFHRFPDLPGELQKEIWDTAMGPWQPQTYTGYKISRYSWTLLILLPRRSKTSQVKWLWVCPYTRRQFINNYGHPATTDFFFNSNIDILRISSSRPELISTWTAELGGKVMKARGFFAGRRNAVYPDESVPYGRNHLELFRTLNGPDGTPSALYCPTFHGLDVTLGGSIRGGIQGGYDHLMPDAQGRLVPFSKKPRVLLLGAIPSRVRRIEALDDASLCYVLHDEKLAAPSKVEDPRHPGINELSINCRIFHGPWGIHLEDLRAIIANFLGGLRGDGDIETLSTIRVFVIVHDDLYWPQHLHTRLVDWWMQWVDTDQITEPMVPFLETPDP